LNKGVIVYDGHDADPTIEGPKLYKRNDYYFIFAPAGGVSTGWQLVLRSKNIYGPYERKVVMDQGTTPVNGPHQGAWITTQTGEDWFLHFQDKDAYGRVLHLQPMKWINDWPVIGVDKDGDGKGEPVLIYKKPGIGKVYPIMTPVESDEFNDTKIGLQWQWQANPVSSLAFPSNGKLRLYSYQLPDSVKNFWEVPSLLMQKFPAEEFMVTAKLTFKARLNDEKAGLIIFGADYAYVCVVKKPDGNYIDFSICKNADKGSTEIIQEAEKITGTDCYFRAKVEKGGICEFSYSTNGINFKNIGEKLIARPGRWVGAKMGLFCIRTIKTNDSGFADIDWFRVEKAH
jgi:beta-xylosidase